ncbi:MAG: hypothetical protein E7296_09200 [Lachnospiraceae bacterium]|jgi:hypothetical protein|nr:hypothetical protein [Lachnospiraceae bacterium]
MKTSKTGLFLMELIISILFFALAGTVCIQLFAKAHMLDGKTAAENGAIVKCEDFCEIYYGVLDDNPEVKDRMAAMAKVTGATVNDANDLVIYYDEEFNACEAEGAAYYLLFRDLGLDEATGLYSGHAKVMYKDPAKQDTIYELTVSKHVPNVLQ